MTIKKLTATIYSNTPTAGHFSITLSGWDIQRRENIIMGTANQVEQELMNYISDHKIINTHSHHLPEQMMTDFSLDNSKNPLYFVLKYSGF